MYCRAAGRQQQAACPAPGAGAFQVQRQEQVRSAARHGTPLGASRAPRLPLRCPRAQAHPRKEGHDGAVWPLCPAARNQHAGVQAGDGVDVLGEGGDPGIGEAGAAIKRDQREALPQLAPHAAARRHRAARSGWGAGGGAGGSGGSAGGSGSSDTSTAAALHGPANPGARSRWRQRVCSGHCG